VANKNYKKIGMADLPAVEDDRTIILEKRKEWGFTFGNVKNFSNLDWQDFNDLFDELMSTVRNNYINGKQVTLIFFYYSGHGRQDNYTFAVSNDPAKPNYPLEAMVRRLGTEPGAYVFAVLDCCREKFDATAKVVREDIRGGGTLENLEEVDMTGYCNLILIFGCPPNETVAAKSPVAENLVKRLDSELRRSGGVILPDAINHFRPTLKGETTS
jgi:hypothetical protein